MAEYLGDLKDDNANHARFNEWRTTPLGELYETAVLKYHQDWVFIEEMPYQASEDKILMGGVGNKLIVVRKPSLTAGTE